MSLNLSIHSQHDSASIHPVHTAGRAPQSKEAQIEARIQNLDEQLENMNVDPRVIWLKTGPHVYSPEFDLSVKVEAIRWMLRIAKHMHESARQAVFARVENSLRQLECALEATEWSSVT
jgi:hypothetical protein